MGINPIRFTIKKPLLALILLGAVIGGTAFMGWLVTDTVFEKTGDADFCGSCHTMQPMVAAFFQDAHGGNNVNGTMSKCVDCHLPHETRVGYVLAKTQYGLHDVWAQTFYDLEKIDWQEKRLHRESFVYDSGCLTCHKNIEKASEKTAKTFVAHKPYFMGEIDKKCVTCHEHVGHKNLHFSQSEKPQ